MTIRQLKMLPPNFKDIVAVFPMARGQGVIFAYAPDIYTLNDRPLTYELVAHERVHIERQKEIGVTFWWKKYLEDPEFRFNEELLAHRAEYQSLITTLAVQSKRDKALRHVARKLASGLYNHMITPKQAKVLLEAP
jgi:hypothetical protein